MLTYDILTDSQRRWVNLVEFHYPDITTEITYLQIKEIHIFFTEKRLENKNFKCAKALWLITNNAISRGVYSFPSSKAPEKKEVEILDSLEIGYREQLSAHGIPLIP